MTRSGIGVPGPTWHPEEKSLRTRARRDERAGEIHQVTRRPVPSLDEATASEPVPFPPRPVPERVSLRFPC